MSAQADRVAVRAGVVGRTRGLRAGGCILQRGHIGEGRKQGSGKGRRRGGGGGGIEEWGARCWQMWSGGGDRVGGCGRQEQELGFRLVRGSLMIIYHQHAI
jgi:hypothetical protein